ncbi:endonuclease III [Gracilinema caldarium]|uniref:Endonuclease III n=1 Tax=Gracilinema caldarium (strain ATCC 51460 / DSM 7334 / H1) TaxID=744872 RepID=F8F0I2_GRAC1|nr:endonuclease III [Gracilinema caldarium]AEJ19326.1 endonuclease III [Gracilinema caldarium DSM 7334]
MHRETMAQFVYNTLAPLYPDIRPALYFTNPFQLLVATVLSAQCTDERVNQVTPALFERFPSPELMAKADKVEVESLIYSTGFYHDKARALLDLSRSILRDYGGHVPDTMEELTRLRGVGRKTASVILSACYNKPALIVDTHVSRICLRLGFTTTRDPDKVEAALALLYQENQWITIGHCLNQHGRRVCTARKPQCTACPLSSNCPKVGIEVISRAISDCSGQVR